MESHNSEYRYWHSLNFVEGNYEALLKKYENEFVAVHLNKVIAHGVDRDSVVELTRQSEVELAEVHFEYFSTSVTIR